MIITKLSKRLIKIVAYTPLIIFLFTIMLSSGNPPLHKDTGNNPTTSAIPKQETIIAAPMPEVIVASNSVAPSGTPSKNQASTNIKGASSKKQSSSVNYEAIDHPLPVDPSTVLPPLPPVTKPQRPIWATDFEMSYDLWSQFSGQYHALSKLDYTKEKDATKFNLTEMGAIEAINRITVEKVKDDKYLFLEPPTFTLYVKAQTLYCADRDARYPNLTPAERVKAIAEVNAWLVSFDKTLAMYKTELEKLK